MDSARWWVRAFRVDAEKQRKIAAKAALTFFILFAGTSCSVEKEVLLAQKTVDQARSVHSEQHAPYHFFSAELYLDEARHQLLLSDFPRAEKYARTSRKNAHLAGAAVKEKGLWPDSLIDPAAILSPPAGEKLPETERTADGSKNGGKTDVKAQIHFWEKGVQRIAGDGAKTCAPKELAAAEAHLEFARDDWREGR